MQVSTQVLRGQVFNNGSDTILLNLTSVEGQWSYEGDCSVQAFVLTKYCLDLVFLLEDDEN
jgi:hypothetical protein